jgi:hypothetical protein
MKLDMDLVREILLEIEAKDLGKNADIEVVVPSYSEEEVNYHVGQLVDAGYIRAHEIPDTESDGVLYEPFAMTWSGHQFIETIRDSSVWGKVKSVAVERGGALTVEIVAGLASQYAKSLVGL